MKKALKILAIALSSIIGLVLLVIGLAIWVVVTPERLTPIVREVASEYVQCEHTIGKVELTFFSTFPRFGLNIDSVMLINPIEGAPNDTVVAIPQMKVSLDVMDLLEKQTVTINELRLPDVVANIYVDSEGRANYDVVALPADTVEDSDTTSTTLPLQKIVVEQLLVSARHLHYTDNTQGLSEAINNLQLTIDNAQVTMDSLRLAVDNIQLAAGVRHSSLALSGKAEGTLERLWMDMSATVDVVAEDVKEFLPADMQVKGRVKGNATIQMYLDDLMAMQLEKGKIKGDMQLIGVNYHADGIEARLPNNRLQLEIPNSRPSRKEVDWLAATLHTDGGEVNMDTPLAAAFGKTKIAIEANNILGNDPWLHATVALQSDAQLHAMMDSMDMTIARPSVRAYAAYHMQDTSKMPVLDAEVAFEHVKGYYTDIQVDIQPSTLTARLQAPRLQASLQTAALVAQMGEEIYVQTGATTMTAAARYNKNGGDNLLLKWNPRLAVDMHEAEATLAGFEQKITIPEIDFTYSNRNCKIEQSKIVIGNSDFALTGELKNIGRWMRNRGVLEGELTFESETTDVNELLALVSAEEGSEEESIENTAEPQQNATTASSVEASEDSEPFLVPTNVDLTLNTLIKEAKVLDQTAYNLGGKVYVKDGVLVIEEMGFICNAAKLQLTAMYRTPRRNHIYVGFDYHMIDINIQELIGMIPQLDSMMPMLRSFKGEAEFHLAAETYTNAQYEVKPSTLRGAASIFGKDLVVLDNETFDKISKLLLFSKKTENKVDSISAEMTLYKKEIDVYPFCVSMDNYMVAIGGRHNLDMSFNYDVNVLSPVYLGVNVSGRLDDLDIKLAPCKFAKDFKPRFHRKVDTQSAELRSVIRESMRKNVKL
ncbi:MAG: AsmA family protein [Paludibacteraceae bacterium]|nr:AsmA family protein [Paludibacteraceae bacterium]